SRQIPDADGTPNRKGTGIADKSGDWIDEIRGDHQVDFRPDGDAVRIEAVRRRIFGPLTHELSVSIELGHSTRSISGGGAHHGYQEPTFGQGHRIVGDA